MLARFSFFPSFFWDFECKRLHVGLKDFHQVLHYFPGAFAPAGAKALLRGRTRRKHSFAPLSKKKFDNGECFRTRSKAGLINPSAGEVLRFLFSENITGGIPGGILLLASTAPVVLPGAFYARRVVTTFLFFFQFFVTGGTAGGILLSGSLHCRRENRRGNYGGHFISSEDPRESRYAPS